MYAWLACRQQGFSALTILRRMPFRSCDPACATMALHHAGASGGSRTNLFILNWKRIPSHACQAKPRFDQ
jgi:hypothetical protein